MQFHVCNTLVIGSIVHPCFHAFPSAVYTIQIQVTEIFYIKVN